jgi:hypothetical protein
MDVPVHQQKRKVEMKDPASELCDCNTLINALNRSMRNPYATNLTEVITLCQSLKSNLSYIEDWAFQKGKSNGS